MDILSFISSIVRSEAWPSVVIFFLILCRKQMTGLVSSISELSIGKDGIKTNFDRRAQEVKRDIIEAKKESAAQISQQAGQNVDNVKPDSGSPALIAAAWHELEELLRRKLQNSGVDTSALGTTALIQSAIEHGVITEIQRRSLAGLNAMRNLALQGPANEIDTKRVEDFTVMVDAMKTVLDIT